MKSLCHFFVVISMLLCELHGQSLVVNGSFENHLSCPTTLGQISLSVGWMTPPAMDISSPDYFNACGSPPVGVPYNLTGNQNAFDGSAYAGIATHSPLDGYREYIQTLFSEPLFAGMQYLISFRVSGAGAGFSNNIGASVSVNQIEGDGTFRKLGAVPQINATDMVTNTVGWTEISGTYIASGGESYLTIGNFFDDSQTQTSAANVTAYYYIDDVSVTALSMAVNEPERNKLVIYPNPVSDTLNIYCPASEIETIEVYSIFGKSCESLIDNAVRLGHLPAGIYVVVVKTKDGTAISRKIQKI